MVISKEILSDFKETFEKVQKLTSQDAQDNSSMLENTPQEVAYQILKTLLAKLRDIFDNLETGSEDFPTFAMILAYIYKELGKLDTILQRSSNAEENLQLCLGVINENAMDPTAIITYVAAKIELGLSATNQESYPEARKHFEEAEQAYKQFKASKLEPLTVFEILSCPEDIEKREGRTELGKLYTHTTYYLAQVLSKQEEDEKSAAYCNITLRRQLEADDFQPIDWALNAATLSQYYLTPNRFTESRHHLAAATFVMLEYEQKMITGEMNGEEEEAARETFNHRFADVARCWTKYGLALLSASKERLMSDEAPKSPSKSGSWHFPSLKLPPYEVTDQFCLTFEDAKPVYLFVKKWMDRAKQYYCADLEASEYAKIVTDEADLYKLLAFFEDDTQVQCKYLKKRVDLLEHILEILNPLFYLAICRQTWYEVAMSYSTMLDMKIDALNPNENATAHQRKKINTLAEKAVTHLQALIDSYKEKNSIPEDEMQIYLCAHFYIGRLFYKVITPDRKLQLKNLQNSYRYYDLFVLKCTEHKAAGDRLKGEVAVCREMVNLLPVKIESLVREIGE